MPAGLEDGHPDRRPRPRAADAAAVEDVWGSGDYGPVARRLQPGADALAAVVRRRCGRGRGRRAIDVAAGTGNVALALARDRWSVLATDLAPRMVQRGAERSAAEGLDVAWRVADLADQPVEEASCALVASAFGLVFAGDPRAAAAEAARALEPGGLLALAAWHPTGLVAQTADLVASALDALDDDAAGAGAGARAARTGSPAAWDAFSWGEEGAVRRLLDPLFRDVRLEAGRLPWDFASRAELRRFLGEQSPSHAAAVRRLGPRGPRLLDDMVELHAPWTDRSGRVRAALDLVVVSAVRR